MSSESKNEVRKEEEVRAPLDLPLPQFAAEQQQDQQQQNQEQQRLLQQQQRQLLQQLRQIGQQLRQLQQPQPQPQPQQNHQDSPDSPDIINRGISRFNYSRDAEDLSGSGRVDLYQAFLNMVSMDGNLLSDSASDSDEVLSE